MLPLELLVGEQVEIRRKCTRELSTTYFGGWRLIGRRVVGPNADIFVGSVAGIEYIIGEKVSLQADVSFADTALESGGRGVALCWSGHRDDY
jgi:hypothetical protein